MSGGELISAREIELIDRKDLESILLKQGYVTEIDLNTAKELLVSINDGKMNREQAAQILQNNEHRPVTASVIERDFLLDPRGESEFSEENKPALESNAESQFSAESKAALEPNAESESIAASKSAALPEVSEIMDEKQSSSGPTAPETSPESQLLENLSLAVTGEIPQVGASETEAHQIETGQTETPQTGSGSASQSQSPPEEQPRTPGSEPIKPPRAKTMTIEIDRVKLLRTANFIDDKQIKEALTISNAHNTSLFRTLFDTGEIDQPAVNLAGAAKRHIESGRIDIPRAVKIMRHCKEHKMGFDEALDALEGTL
jgi:hypothetical protein